MKYWNEHFECMPREEIRILQSRRLQKLVDRVYNNVPHYREKMIAAGVEPGDIRTVDDIVKLPFTVKQDLRDTYPFGMFAVPMSDINRIHASSGTTGKQTVVGYTARDLDIWAECMARSGIPISTVFTGRSAEAIDPSVLPPGISERFTNFWYAIFSFSQICWMMAIASQSVA